MGEFRLSGHMSATIDSEDAKKRVDDFLQEVRQTAVTVSGFTGVKKACDLIFSVLASSNFTVKDFGDTSAESGLIGTLTVVGDYSGKEYKVGYGRPKFRLYHVNQDKDN